MANWRVIVTGLSWMFCLSLALDVEALTFDNGMTNICTSNLGEVVLVEDSSAGIPTTLVVSSGCVMTAGGTLDPNAVRGASVIRVEGGFSDFVHLFDSSTLIMSSGFSDVHAYDLSTVMFTGGTLDDLSTCTTFFQGPPPPMPCVPTITRTGGSVFDATTAEGSGVITIFGSSFEIDGVPVGLGPISATEGRLSGVLASGETFTDEFFLRDPTGQIILAPEPSITLLLASALAALFALRLPKLMPRSSR